MVHLSKFTACIGQHAYLTRFFVRHDKLHAFHTRVSRLLVHETMLTSYATRTIVCIPTQVRLPVHANLLASCVMQ